MSAADGVQKFSHWLHACVWPALLIASIVHWIGYLLPLELPAVLLAARVAEHYEPASPRIANDPRRTLAIATIDQDAFDCRYHSRSPLDRCQLFHDLETLLMSPIETVAVDLDLTPINARLTTDGQRCQDRLERLLLDHGKQLVVLLDRQTPESWSKRFEPTIFADATLPAPFGVVYQHDTSLGIGLASVLSWRMCRSEQHKGAQAGHCKHVDSTMPGRFANDHKHGFQKNPISFSEVRHLYNDGIPLSIEAVASAAFDGKIRHVLVGGEYGRDDLHETSIGPRYGVAIHAAIAAQPRRHDSHLLVFLLDFLTGALLFGPLIAFCWKRYFVQRLGRAHIHGTGWRWEPNLAYVWIGLMAVGCMALLVLLLVVSAILYATCSRWINPVPVFVGTAFDALALGSVHASLGLLGAPEGQTSSARSFLQHFWIGAPRALGLAVLGFTLLDLTRGLL